jgi:hypothetical protein
MSLRACPANWREPYSSGMQGPKNRSRWAEKRNTDMERRTSALIRAAKKREARWGLAT